MKKGRRFMAVLAALAIAAPGLFAGGSTESASSKGPVTIKILFSHTNAEYAKAVTDWKNDVYAKELNRLSGYNIEWEFGPHVEYPQFISVRFASGDLPDIIRTDSVDSLNHPGAVDNGIFTEMGPLLDKYGPDIKKNILPDLWTSPMVAKNGKIYAIPVMAPYAATRVVYYRQDWLDQAGMPIPKTIDDCLKYYEWVKQNKKDAYGYYVRENMAYSELFFGAYGVHPSTWQYVDGQFVPSMILPQMKEPIKLWKSLFDKGYVNPNMFTCKSSDWNAGIYSNKAGSWQHDVGNYELSWVNQMLDKTAKLTMAAAPAGPTGNKGLVPAGNRFYFSMVFPAKSKVTADAVKFLEKCWTDPAIESFFLWGIKGRNYTLDAAGKIQWDAANPYNKNANEQNVYRISLNPTVYHYDTPKILALRPNAQVYLDGIQTAAGNAIPNIAINMPQIDVFKTAPELRPGFNSGSLFLDMFAAVVTGKADPDASFDKFVADWKKRGGDEAVKQATDWYNKNQKK